MFKLLWGYDPGFKIVLWTYFKIDWNEWIGDKRVPERIFDWHLLIILFPLFGRRFAGLCGRWLGSNGASLVTFSGVFFALILSLCAFVENLLVDIEYFDEPSFYYQLAPWIDLGFSRVYWSFLFDSMRCVMLVVVTSISTLVHLYSIEYMSEDPHRARFMAYLSFFTFFMLILVRAGNFVQMFVGWEGVGLCSFLLINFWFGRIQANKAAIKAMIVNRIGDFGLSIALFLIYNVFGSLDYEVVFALAQQFKQRDVYFAGLSWLHVLDVIGFFLFVGAVGKSAQVGLHRWLPDAMEGPTPVSALIHAATMVTAGVFLICRSSPLLQYAPHISVLITIMGGMTAFLAATTGLLQNDLKRVIAYSTCSQLGYMVFAAGLSGYAVSMFHLSNHAFFKALLFLGAGSVIHARSDEQDRRRMGGLVKILPLTYAAMFIGSLALMGFPFLAGFYSKDVILELAFGSYRVHGRFVYTLGRLAAFFRAFYSRRLLSLTFLRAPNGYRVSYEHAHEPGLPRALPLMILSIASVFVGYVRRDMMIGLGTDFWSNSILMLPTAVERILEGEWLPRSIKLVPLFFSFSGAISSFVIYGYFFNSLYFMKLSSLGLYLYNFFNRKWLFDKVYNEWVSQPVVVGGYTQTYQNMDRGLIELFGPKGIFTWLYSLTIKNPTSPQGFVFTPAFLILVGFFSIFLFIYVFQTSLMVLFFDFSLLVFISITFLFL